MEYSDTQKKVISNAILPHICVEGGTLLLKGGELYADQDGHVLAFDGGEVTSDVSTHH